MERARHNSKGGICNPLEHEGKHFSAFGFPEGNEQGRSASGVLRARDGYGLIQMDGKSSLFVTGGYSGTPVWSTDLSSYIGLVATELANLGVAWCIPSWRLCEFLPTLPVKFRIPKTDRPVINDYQLDDPNISLFGAHFPDDGTRRLRVTIRHNSDPNLDEQYEAIAVYECKRASRPPSGHYVTFIMHPSYTTDLEDAYELFAELNDRGKATVTFYPEESFTIAAVGDGGDTALTFDLKKVVKKPAGFH